MPYILVTLFCENYRGVYDIDLAIDILLSILFKFADDTKAGRVVATETDQSELQNEINKFLEWAETWQMSFNSSKCSDASRTQKTWLLIHHGGSCPCGHYS